MLSAPALASALPVVANLEARGLMVKPIAGSPLDTLVKASYADIELAWPVGMMDNSGDRMADPDNKYEVDLTILAAQTNRPSDITGYCEQDISLAELADVAATAVIGHLQFARTVVAPTIENFADILAQPLSLAMADAVSDFEVSISKLPAPMLESAVLDAVRKAKDIAGENMTFDLKLPRMAAVSIVGFMKSGSPSVDGAIDDWADTLPAGFLESVWGTVFTRNDNLSGGSAPMSDSVWSRTPEGLDAALASFLIARRIWDKPVDDVEMKLDEYQNKMAFLRDQAAVRLNGEINMADRNEQYGTLIKSQGKGGKIVVNDVVYRKFLQDGGNNEVLFGNALRPRPQLSADDILASKEDCEKAWNNYLAFNRLALSNKRFTIVKTMIRVEFASWVLHASLDELPVNMRESVMQRFDAALDRTTQAETEQLTLWVQRLFCASVYYRTDAGMILDTINDVMSSNQGMDVREAAAVAAVNYAATWVGRQLQVVPAKM